jgi:hypothetical protein
MLKTMSDPFGTNFAESNMLKSCPPRPGLNLPSRLVLLIAFQGAAVSPGGQGPDARTGAVARIGAVIAAIPVRKLPRATTLHDIFVSWDSYRGRHENGSRKARGAVL